MFEKEERDRKAITMKKNRLLFFSAFVCMFVSAALSQQPPAGAGVPVHLVVTVEPRKADQAPVINREDVMVYEGHDRDQVTN